MLRKKKVGAPSPKIVAREKKLNDRDENFLKKIVNEWKVDKKFFMNGVVDIKSGPPGVTEYLRQRWGVKKSGVR
jgi:hypothetical protein